MSLKASVKRRTQPLNDRSFDFTDEFKHSRIEPFYLANFNTTQEIKDEKANYCETAFISK